MKKNDIIARLKEAHLFRYKKNPEVIGIAPGRVNIIGEHTDYNNGLAMPAAINRYIFVSLSYNKNKLINAYSEQLNRDISVSLDDIHFHSIWDRYVLGAVKEISDKYSINQGLDILILSNLPMGKGISSSAALEVALINGILKILDIKESDYNIIKICQKIDHKYVGIKSGILDQSASQLSKKGSVLKIDFNKKSFDYIKSDFSGCSWVLVDSMIKRELATSKYHERVEESQKAISIISKAQKKDITFREISMDDIFFLAKSHPILFKRLKHIFEENQRVEEMELAILNKDSKEIGKILNQSHSSLKNLYEVSCLEINYLIFISSKFTNWYGGRIMGGGFGGNTINLIKNGYEDKYSSIIKKKYKEKFNIKPDVYNVKFSNGVEIIDNISVD